MAISTYMYVCVYIHIYMHINVFIYIYIYILRIMRQPTRNTQGYDEQNISALLKSFVLIESVKNPE